MMDCEVKIIFVIPAYRPTSAILPLLERLTTVPQAAVIVVDDGSLEKSLFSHEVFKNVILLQHAVNRGKGAALKTAFNHALIHFPQMVGVITLDADGQHHVEDALALYTHALKNPKTFILGVRDFKVTPHIPLRSRLGNRISIFVWRLLTGFTLKDTQTGLRYIPGMLMERCLLLNANRYEFETDMLLLAHDAGFSLEQLPIQTIYMDNNSSSHFNPWKDSLKIYFSLLRFAASGLVCTLVDYGIYLFAIHGAAVPPAFAFAIARCFSLILNFHLNRRIVFKGYKTPGQFLQYLALSLFNIAAGYFVLSQIPQNWTALGCKIIIDLLLFFLNFMVQKEFIFRRQGVE
jgi:putative flippase GtrA